MLNAAGKQTLALKIVNKATQLPARYCEVLEIADDGVYFEESRHQHFGHTIMSSGRRVEWLVNCMRAGTYEVNFLKLIYYVYKKNYRGNQKCYKIKKNFNLFLIVKSIF